MEKLRVENPEFCFLPGIGPGDTMSFIGAIFGRRITIINIKNTGQMARNLIQEFTTYSVWANETECVLCEEIRAMSTGKVLDGGLKISFLNRGIFY